MNYLTPQHIDDYCSEHSTPQSELLNELERQTHLTKLHPRMLSGHIQGSFLRMLIGLLNPGYIVEVGTYTGFSAISMGELLAPDSQLHTLEIDEELRPFIKKYIDRAGLSDRIKVHFGDAVQIIPTLSDEIDLVFVDADKERYPTYFDLLIPKIRKGGLMIADNVLWSGKVIDHQNAPDETTKAIHQFNELVRNDHRVENVMLPVRDGLNMIRKL